MSYTWADAYKSSSLIITFNNSSEKKTNFQCFWMLEKSWKIFCISFFSITCYFCPEFVNTLLQCYIERMFVHQYIQVEMPDICIYLLCKSCVRNHVWENKQICWNRYYIVNVLCMNAVWVKIPLIQSQCSPCYLCSYL